MSPILIIAIITVIGLGLCFAVAMGNNEALVKQNADALTENLRLIAENTAMKAALDTALMATMKQNHIIRELRAQRITDLAKAYVARHLGNQDIDGILRDAAGKA